MSIARVALEAARPAHRRPTRTRRPTDSARMYAAPPTRCASLTLDRSRQRPRPAWQSPEPTCPMAQRMTDSNHQAVRVRDQHIYAAYSTYPVGDTGSPPRVSMPPQLPAQIALIRTQPPAPAPPPVGAPQRTGAP